MTSDQILTIALASVPTMLTVMISLMINNSRLSDLASRLSDVDSGLNVRVDDLNSRIDDLRGHMDTRFDDQRAMWQADLHRVEEVLDARLKHLEER